MSPSEALSKLEGWKENDSALLVLLSGGGFKLQLLSYVTKVSSDKLQFAWSQCELVVTLKDAFFDEADSLEIAPSLSFISSLDIRLSHKNRCVIFELKPPYQLMPLTEI